MTTYILHGGETGVDNEHNKNFYRSWVDAFDESKTPIILLVYFARPESEWDELEKSDRERFAQNTGNAEAGFVVASKDIKILRDQIRSADVVYVRGGDYEEVVKVFDHIKDEFHALLNGKVYAGSSAGVLAISQYGRSHSTSEWKPGLGLIPAVSFVHYSENGKESVEAFKSEHKDTDYEYLLLPETEFVIREY